MNRHARRGLVCMLACLAPLCGHADIDESEYEFKKTVRSAAERKQLEIGFEADREKAAELQRQEEAREQARLEEEKAAWEALPAPVRLTRTRCTLCHAADNYTNQRHNRIGWELVILRMQVLNDAPLGPGERSVIAAQLAQAYPASGLAAWVEVLQQLAVALMPFWLWLSWKILRARRAGNK